MREEKDKVGEWIKTLVIKEDQGASFGNHYVRSIKHSYQILQGCLIKLDTR